MCAKSKKEVTYIKLLRPIELKTNFFEKRVGEYSNKSNPNIDQEKNEINFDDDF